MLYRLLVLAGCAAVSFAAAPGKIFPYPYTQEDLPNSLRLITVPTDYANIVAVYIVVQTGSRNEIEPGHTGFAHLFEHLMFRGTPQYPSEKYSQILNRAGAASNASTWNDKTVYHTTFSKEDLDTVLAMEADRFQHLKVGEAEYRTETLAVLGEYNKNSANPMSKLNEVLYDTAFQRHTYKHTAMGFLRDIQDMPNQYEYSLKFFDRYYRPEYTTIIVAGDVKPKSVRAMVDKYWGGWKRGSYHPTIPPEPPQDAPRAAKVDWPSPTLPLVMIGYKGPRYDDTTTDTAALDALSDLAFSSTSDLYQRLVVKDQKVDSLSANAPAEADPGLFEIVARVKRAEDLDYVRDQIFTTVKHFQEHPVDASKLEQVRKRQRYQMALSMDNSDAIASVLSFYVALKRSPATMNALFDQYAKLTPQDIQGAATKYLVEKGRTMVTLTGPGGAK